MEVRLNLYKACGSFTTSLSFTTEQTQGSVESSLLVLYNVQKNGKTCFVQLDCWRICAKRRWQSI